MRDKMFVLFPDFSSKPLGFHVTGDELELTIQFDLRQFFHLFFLPFIRAKKAGSKCQFTTEQPFCASFYRLDLCPEPRMLPEKSGKWIAFLTVRSFIALSPEFTSDRFERGLIFC